MSKTTSYLQNNKTIQPIIKCMNPILHSTPQLHMYTCYMFQRWASTRWCRSKGVIEPVRRKRQQPIYNPRQRFCSLRKSTANHQMAKKQILIIIINTKTTVLCFHKIDLINFVFPQFQLHRFCVSTKNKNNKIEKMWEHKIFKVDFVETQNRSS